jgi:hypothetical protein
MNALSPEEIRNLKVEKRELLRQMRELGIKRTSCFNRLDDRTYKFNARIFAINTKLGAS